MGYRGWSWLLLLLSHFSRVQLCATPQTAAHQAPLSLEFSRQEYWSGLPFPSPRLFSHKALSEIIHSPSINYERSWRLMKLPRNLWEQQNRKTSHPPFLPQSQAQIIPDSRFLCLPPVIRCPGGSDSKDSKECLQLGDLGLIPGLGRSPEEVQGYPLQYSCLENPMEEELGRLQSMGSQRVRHDWVTNTNTRGL